MKDRNELKKKFKIIMINNNKMDIILEIYLYIKFRIYKFIYSQITHKLLTSTNKFKSLLSLSLKSF